MKTAFFLLAISTLSFQVNAQGTLIGSYGISHTSGGRVILSHATFWFGVVSEYAPEPPRDPTVFENLQLTSTDVGRTFTVTAWDSSNFAALAALLTNGREDLAGYMVNGAGMGMPESLMFAPLPGGINAVDFQGCIIERISLEILGLTLSSPGSNPNGDGVWTDTTFSARLNVFGTPVPEPTVLQLVVILGAALMLLRWKRLPRVR